MCDYHGNNATCKCHNIRDAVERNHNSLMINVLKKKIEILEDDNRWLRQELEHYITS